MNATAGPPALSSPAVTPRDPHELSMMRGFPGNLPAWVRWVIAVACVVTVVALFIGAALLWDQISSRRGFWRMEVDRFWFKGGLAAVVALVIVTSFLPSSRLSRFLRLSVLVPVIHAGVIVAAWMLWQQIEPHMKAIDGATALATELPFAKIVAGGIVSFATIAWVMSRSRSGEWVQGFTMFALAELLLLGLWIPIACSAWPGGITSDSSWWDASDPLAPSSAQIALALIPPTIAALAFTAVALRRPSKLLAWRPAITQTICAVLAVALLTRMTGSPRAIVLYSNYVPVLLAAALVAVAALVVLGAVMGWRSWRQRRAFAKHAHCTGVIAGGPQEVAVALEVTSWLRGPRIVQRPFVIETQRGSIPVSGAAIIASTPAITTQLKIGEGIALLRGGDRVMLAGHLDAGGDPFRTSAVPIADQMLVKPLESERGAFAHVALAMWRPSVAYLLIMTAVALPALAAALGTD